jgi:hypothetical protein
MEMEGRDTLNGLPDSKCRQLTEIKAGITSVSTEDGKEL